MDKDSQPANDQPGTARKENALGISDNDFKRLFEVLPDAVVITNHRGEIQFANHRAETLFGYQPGELTGQPVEVLIPARFDEHDR